MTRRPDIRQLIQQRNPLRQKVQPVDLYATPSVEETENHVSSDETESSKQASDETSQQASTETENHANLETRKQMAITKKRYATYLRTDTIKRLQRYAFDREVPDYQVVQEAIDDYLRH